MTVRVAPAAPPMPRARCPAWRPITVAKNHFSVVAASCMRLRTRSLPRSQAVVNPKVTMSLGSGRSLSIVLGTWATVRPDTALATREAAKAVSSPPMAIRWWTPRACRASATRRGPSGDPVGLAREVRKMEPPSKWMRETSSMASSTTWEVSPAMSQRKPS